MPRDLRNACPAVFLPLWRLWVPRVLLLGLLLSFTAGSAPVQIPAETLHDRIRGGLLGQMLGNLNGLPHEMKYIQEPGGVTGYTPSLPEGAWTDDEEKAAHLEKVDRAFALR